MGQVSSQAQPRTKPSVSANRSTFQSLWHWANWQLNNLALKMALSCHSQQPLVGGRVILFRSCPAVVSPTKVEELSIAERAQKAV